jgi:dihydropteroate synthase
LSHHARILSLHSRAEIEREMQRVGSDYDGIAIMAPKGEHVVMRLGDVRGKAAAMLKQAALSVGCEAAVARGVGDFDDTPAPVLLMGDRRHLRRLHSRLRRQPFGLKAIALEIEQILRRWNAALPPIPCGERELSFERTRVMGIINVTPDSFSGDGVIAVGVGGVTDPDGIAVSDRSHVTEAAIAQGVGFAEAGADILDVGGESTRPGSEGVSVEEELRRVLPVIEGLAAKVSIPISIDSSKPDVCREALGAGATIINDVYGLRQAGMLELAAETGAPVCIMHMQGRPRDMQHDPQYADVVTEVYGFLAERIAAAVAAGVAEERIIIDPGFGFGKTTAHNLELVRRLREFRSLGRPVLLGPSRKRTIGDITGKDADERILGTAAVCAIGIANGASIIRVHDVPQMVDVARMADAIGGQPA